MRWLIIVVLLLLPIQAHALLPVIVAEEEATAESATACSNLGSNTVYYDSDHTTSDTTVCVVAGTDSATLTNAATSVEQNHTVGGTKSVKHEAGANEKYTIPVGTPARLSSSEGYISIWVYPTGTTGVNYIYYFFKDTNNNIVAYVNAGNTVSLEHKGNSITVTVTSTATVTDGQWNHVELRWSVANNQTGVKINDGTWKTDTDGDVVTASATGEPTAITVGPNTQNVVDTYYTDDVSIDDASGI